MIITYNSILTILTLSAGLWWFYRMRQEKTLPLRSAIGYLLLAIFATYNSLVCMFGTSFVMASIVKDFVTLAIMPVMYNIVAGITTGNVSRRKSYLVFLPALIVGTVNAVLRLAATSPYAAFIDIYLFNITLFIQLSFLGIYMLKIFYTYSKRIFCYYVDIQATDFNKAHYIVQCFFFATIISYLQLLFQRGSLDGSSIILLFVNLSVALIICIVGWNMACMSGDTVVIDVTVKPYTPAEVLEMAKRAGTEFPEKTIMDGNPPASDTSSSQAIEEIINNWSKRPEKPYLREGISLSMAAEEMGLSVRVVSFYLNNVLHINFNAWINLLRIEEATRLLNRRTPLPVSVIAFKCGFADTPMLSKNFKKIMGMTITEYKKKNNLV